MSKGTSDGASEWELTPEEERTLTCILDEIIPASDDGRLPGAGAIGLARTIALRAPELRPAIVQGIADLDERAQVRGAAGFAELPSDARAEVLNEHESVGAGLLRGLIFHTYVSYYQDGRVAIALGLEARPPFPQGYELEAGDFSLLDAVRQRPKLFRG
jgi:hypothetical protein